MGSLLTWTSSDGAATCQAEIMGRGSGGLLCVRVRLRTFLDGGHESAAFEIGYDSSEWRLSEGLNMAALWLFDQLNTDRPVNPESFRPYVDEMYYDLVPRSI